MTDHRVSAGLTDYLKLCRPKQWVKNVLVAAAPFAAGVLADAPTAIAVGLGMVAFALVSSAAYALNDAMDLDEDRNHPRKRERPVAAGRIAPSTAKLFGGALLAAGLAIGFVAGSYGFVSILVVYATTMAAYSVWLKHIALVDIAVIALGFLLRAVSGAVIVDVEVSTWFLIVTTFGALFVAAGKRFSERIELTNSGRDHRAALDDYAPGFIEFLLGVTAAVVLLSYSVWALELQDGAAHIPWATYSLGPFILGVLRYAQLIYLGRGGEPEALMVRDRALQVIGIVWIVVLVLAFYGDGS